MFRFSARTQWLTLALAALCAVQGSVLGIAHHVWCCHGHHAAAPVHAAAHAGCGGACSRAEAPAWSGHNRHSHEPRSDSPHDWRNCLACRYMAERPLPSFTPLLGEFEVQFESPAEVTTSFRSDGAPSNYDSRAPPV